MCVGVKISKKEREEMIEAVRIDCGYFDQEEMLAASVFDGCYGYCRSCGNIQGCEPDAVRAWCYDCEQNGVISVLILAGII